MEAYSPQRGDVPPLLLPYHEDLAYSPQRGDVSFPKIKFIVAPVSSTQWGYGDFVIIVIVLKRNL